MDEPWYRRYFWLLVFGGIILVIAIICFVIVCCCIKQISRSLTLRRTLKQEKKEKRDQTVAVITANRLYQPTAPPTIMLPGTPAHQYDTNAKVDITNQVMYSTVKKEPVHRQQQGINSAYNGPNYKAELQLPSMNDRFSYTSYDSVGHITDIDYVNTDNTNAKVDVSHQVMYSTVKKEPVHRQQQGINSAYNGPNYKAELQLPSMNDRFSYTSYDSVGYITDIDYVNTDNRAKDLEYIDVLAEDDNDYDDVDII
ncbi:uncharacterized protein LOC122932231 [Bufo gargarizans]|uniref:uncharacterized protein LOC122932231 n=1 Tax=Bufo gargarizans TaxID=30331 RepID=UPI001CF20A2D|nr:uncharacterized protein LOC122932231 [Bufo gargarizans]